MIRLSSHLGLSASWGGGYGKHGPQYQYIERSHHFLLYVFCIFFYFSKLVLLLLSFLSQIGKNKIVITIYRPPLSIKTFKTSIFWGKESSVGHLKFWFTNNVVKNFPGLKTHNFAKQVIIRVLAKVWHDWRT